MSSSSKPTKGNKQHYQQHSPDKNKSKQGKPTSQQLSGFKKPKGLRQNEGSNTPASRSDGSVGDVNSSAQTVRVPSPVVIPSPPSIPTPTVNPPAPNTITSAVAPVAPPPAPAQTSIQPQPPPTPVPQQAVSAQTSQPSTRQNSPPRPTVDKAHQEKTTKSLELILKRLDSVATRIIEVETHVIQQATLVDDLKTSFEDLKNDTRPTPSFTQAKGKIRSPNTHNGYMSDNSNSDPTYFEDSIYKTKDPTDRRLFRSNTPTQQNKAKRISILENLIQSGDNTLDATNNHNSGSNVQYTRMIPSFDHIKLNDLTLRAVIKFINDIMDYEFRYKIPINMKAQVSEQCFRRLSIKFHGKIDYQDKYKDMDRNELGRLLLDYVKPETQSQFRQILEDIKLKYSSNTITQDEYKYFYEALIEYSLQFLRWYEILSDQVDPKLIPPCHNKDKGLIKIFLSKLPGELGQELYAELYKEHTILSTDKNITFHTFHELFIQLIESHNSKHISTRYALNMYENVGKYKTKEANKSSTSTINTHKSSSNDRFKHQYGHKVLHNINDNQLETNSDDSDADLNSKEEEQQQTKVNEVENINQLDDFDNDIPDLGFPNDLTDNISGNASTLNAITSSNSSSQSQPKVCFSMIFYNRCEKTNCKYIHEGANMYKAHAHYLSLLSKSKFSHQPQRPSAQQQISYDTKKKIVMNNGRSSGTLSLILPFQCEESYLNSMHTGSNDGFSHFMKKSFMDSFSGTDIIDSVIRSGTVHYNDGSHQIVKKILFDTGALHGNYVSNTWFKANMHLLQDSILDVNTKVKLADNKTVVSIEHVVQLNIDFVDSNNNIHTLSDYFSVIETTTDMIVGLPAIILRLGTYFQDLIHQALRNFSPQICSNLLNHSNVEGGNESSITLQPWANISLSDEAPEDSDTPLPCAFTEALNFMEVGYEQAKQDYLDLIPTHVAKEFIEQTKIMDLLTSKGLDVFIPRNWEGVKGVPPLKLQWRPDVPEFMKPKPWPINPRLYKNAELECQRLRKYFYRKSNSPVASNLVIAPKATPPYIRFCGNYVAIGKYLVTGHYPIPRVTQALEKIVNFCIYLDFDMANSFHQFLIDEYSSGLLSVQTPWGQFEPMFLPEGIPPASGELQKYVDLIFEPIKDFAIVIFDNLLVLAHDYADAYKKVEIVFDLCLKHNLFLKFSKTWLGFSEVKFFGYICKPKSYSLSQERKDALQSIPFPTNKKGMQSFLGAALFFKNFIPNYSSITAPLNDMLKKDFPWDPSQWKLDYHAVFTTVKAALQHASSIFYPNYDLKWILRTDASDFGVGAVLLQVDDSISPPQHQPIQFVSQKLSPQATRWSTIEKEAYAVYFGVKSFAYYLIGKPFILQTDHANLQWMEASVVPKILRWRIYLQSFQFVIQHIAGKANTVADWLSRLSSIFLDDAVANSCISEHDSDIEHSTFNIAYLPPNEFCYVHMLLNEVLSESDSQRLSNDQQPLIPSPYRDPTEVLKQVHNSRMGHHGVRKTYLLLNTHFPGHRIPHKVVADFVATCATCQKERLGMVDNIRPMVKHLKPEHLHSAIGADVLTITPEDEFGNKCLIVIVNHFTKLVFLYAAKTNNAINMATALFVYISIYGLVDILYSDPGSDLMSEAVEHLNKWLGIRHKVSLVDRHQSNGVEGSNKQILRHLRALVYDERVLRSWSSPTKLPIIQYILNSTLNSETNMIPFDLHFGQDTHTYHKIPTNLNLNSQVNTFVHNLNSNLRHLLEVSRTYQQKLVQDRTGSDSNNIQHINQYQPGDYVLKQIDTSKPRPSKLFPQFLGPFEVISHIGNNIRVKNIVTGEIKTFHVDMVKIFHGNRDQAYQMAMIDTEQYEVEHIISYKGDPIRRSTMEFLVKFKDGDEVWVPYSDDIAATQQFETFCRLNSQLFYLLYKADVAKRMASDIKSREITAITPGTTVYVDLRSYGELWYLTLDLPDKFTKAYVLKYRYTKWSSPRNHKKIVAVCEVFDETWTLDNLFVHCFGHTTVFDPSKMVLVTREMVLDKPFLKNNNPHDE